MNNADPAYVLYLVLLGCVLGAWFTGANRKRFGVVLQQALIWVLIFCGGILVYGLREPLIALINPQNATMVGENRIALRRGPNGHFSTVIDVNGAKVNFLVDTGATEIVLSRQDAARAGIDVDALNYFGRAQTANGEVRTAPVRLAKIDFAGLSDTDVRAWVNDGQMSGSLLGMAYLNRFKKIEISGNNMYLTR
jgi:aspartyl protease family protein